MMIMMIVMTWERKSWRGADGSLQFAHQKKALLRLEEDAHLCHDDFFEWGRRSVVFLAFLPFSVFLAHLFPFLFPSPPPPNWRQKIGLLSPFLCRRLPSFADTTNTNNIRGSAV